LIDLSRIRNKEFNLAIIGMGRIGLPLALSFASAGVLVYGVENNQKVLNTLRAGRTHFFEPGMQDAFDKALDSSKITFVLEEEFDYQKCDIMIIAIGTPLKENFQPEMALIMRVISKISKNAHDHSLIILRSTLVPGTTSRQIIPEIKRNNETLHIAVCPERIVEGKAMSEIKFLPEIVGSDESTVGNAAKELFALLGPKEITITDTTTAEAAKIFTNVYRYVNFALANEFAMICENLNIDVREAISLANKSYLRSSIPYPGTAAGPCLRKDGLFLSSTSAINLIRVAWLLNESLPSYIVKSIEQRVGSLNGKTVGVLGKAYKADIDDSRDSPAIRLIEELTSKGAHVLSYDPFIGPSDAIEKVLRSEILILAVNHTEFNTLSAEMIEGTSLVYDVWGQLDKLDLTSYGIAYISLGKGNAKGR
jgi:UDP-N-acetyl-D-mannosaminuronic acid dehydrogenase